MREFYLINAKGEEWNLNNDSTFLHNPSGLGQEHKATYSQIGSRNIKLVDTLEQKKINAKIKVESYERYTELSRFLQYKPIVLRYAAADTYYMQVSVDKLSKSELTQLGLICDMELKGMTTWYKIQDKINDGKSGGKSYPYTYSYSYIDYTKDSIEIDSDSMMDSPVKITLIGPCRNPRWIHYVNGKQAATGSCTCRIESGKMLVIDNTKIPYEIAEYTTMGEYVADRYGDSDFSTDRFLYLRNGNNRIEFFQEEDRKIVIKVEGRIEYESV